MCIQSLYESLKHSVAQSGVCAFSHSTSRSSTVWLRVVCVQSVSLLTTVRLVQCVQMHCTSAHTANHCTANHPTTANTLVHTLRLKALRTTQPHYASEQCACSQSHCPVHYRFQYCEPPSHTTAQNSARHPTTLRLKALHATQPHYGSEQCVCR